MILRFLVCVTVEFHKAFGLKLVLQDVDPSFTLGELERQKQETIEQLIKEGFLNKIGDEFFTDNKRLPLPRVIQKIAVISSAASAGLQDFVHTLEHNDFKYQFEIDYYYAVVQGETKAELVNDQFIQIFASAIRYDVVILIRGGGAQTDFLLFDQFPLAKMIAKFPVPVITGLGHQKNETVADLVANKSVKTPTRAAEFIIARNRDFEESVHIVEKNIIIKTQQLLAGYRESLNHLKGTMITQPKMITKSKLQELQQLRLSVPQSLHSYFRHHSQQLIHQQAILRSLSSANILKRGFAIVKKEGKTISNAGDIQVGDQISIIFNEQQLESVVKHKTNYDGREFDL
ncbi:MAG: exodeoxyribonuclease VII large subunit [Chitinophagaceae bacterium]